MALLAELERDVAVSRHRHRIAACRQFGEFIPAVGIGCRGAVDANFHRGETELRPPQWRAVVGCYDPAADSACAGRRCGIVACGCLRSEADPALRRLAAPPEPAGEGSVLR